MEPAENTERRVLWRYYKDGYGLDLYALGRGVELRWRGQAEAPTGLAMSPAMADGLAMAIADHVQRGRDHEQARHLLGQPVPPALAAAFAVLACELARQLAGAPAWLASEHIDIAGPPLRRLLFRSMLYARHAYRLPPETVERMAEVLAIPLTDLPPLPVTPKEG